MYRRLLSLFAALMLLVIGTLPANASAYGRVEVTSATKASYMGCSLFTTPPASTTDHFQIYGSASKTVKVLRLEAAYSTSATHNLLDQVFLVKRSTANSSGTAGTTTVVPLDSNNAAATATIKVYTANPSTGTLVGQMAAKAIMGQSTSTAGSCPANIPIVLFDAAIAGQPIVLRGTGEGLCVNFNGTIPSATTPKLAYTVIWTEE